MDEWMTMGKTMAMTTLCGALWGCVGLCVALGGSGGLWKTRKWRWR